MNQFETRILAPEKRLSKLSAEESVRAVEKGEKPLSLISKRLSTDLPYIEFSVPYSALRGTALRAATMYVYYRPGQEENANRVKDMVLEMNKNLVHSGVKPSYEYHRELGRLLGYSEQEIEEYVQKLQASRISKEQE